MAIIRINNNANFTIVSNDLINDPLLDWRDVGLLTYLLSKPDTWEVSTAHLQQQKKSGREAIHNSLRSIIHAGYAKRKVSGNGGWIYEVCNAPIYLQSNPNTENPNTENPNTENPNTEKPNTEKPPQVNTDIQQILKEQQILTKSKGDAPKFQKPTADEISAFCLDSGIAIDVQHFIDYYESNGWRVGRNPMKNWQATVRNWAKNDKTFRKPAQTSFKKPYGEPPKYELSSKFKQDHGVEDFIDSTATTISNKGINYGR